MPPKMQHQMPIAWSMPTLRDALGGLVCPCQSQASPSGGVGNTCEISCCLKTLLNLGCGQRHLPCIHAEGRILGLNVGSNLYSCIRVYPVPDSVPTATLVLALIVWGHETGTSAAFVATSGAAVPGPPFVVQHSPKNCCLLSRGSWQTGGLLVRGVKSVC